MQCRCWLLCHVCMEWCRQHSCFYLCLMIWVLFMVLNKTLCCYDQFRNILVNLSNVIPRVFLHCDKSNLSAVHFTLPRRCKMAIVLSPHSSGISLHFSISISSGMKRQWCICCILKWLVKFELGVFVQGAVVSRVFAPTLDSSITEWHGSHRLTSHNTTQALLLTLSHCLKEKLAFLKVLPFLCA